MKCLKFELSGKYAFFKNPEYNLNGYEFSFEHIHKPAILGIIGAILGINGKLNIKKNNTLEYYEILKNILISIEPSKNIFDHFQYDFINSTGYANKGQSQLLKRMCLSNPSWTIYVLVSTLDKNIYHSLCELFTKRQSKYPIYLGDCSFKAKISKFSEITLTNIKKNETEILFSSLFRKNITTSLLDKFNLYMPVSLKNLSFNYNYEWLCISNEKVNIQNNNNIFKYKNKIIYFL